LTQCVGSQKAQVARERWRSTRFLVRSRHRLKPLTTDRCFLSYTQCMQLRLPQDGVSTPCLKRPRIALEPSGRRVDRLDVHGAVRCTAQGVQATNVTVATGARIRRRLHLQQVWLWPHVAWNRRLCKNAQASRAYRRVARRPRDGSQPQRSPRSRSCDSMCTAQT
jgi:hypothetical protein